jgi:hypothetical protein
MITKCALVRTVAEIQKIFSYTPSRVVAFRGATDSVDLADWLIRKLDLPAKAPQSTSAQAKESGRPDTNVNLYRLAAP